MSPSPPQTTNNMARVVLGGVEYPVAVTFAAIAAYLAQVGEDSSEGMSNFSNMPPSRYPVFITACVNEALRKEGKQERINAEWVADGDFIEVSSAVATILNEMVPRSSQDKKKE